MRSIKLYVALLFSFVMLQAASSVAARPGTSPVEKCLNISTNLINDCMQRHLKPKTIDSCYRMSESIYSNQSKENIKNYCFYQISEFPTLKTCVNSARKFYLAESKDQALFECVHQFSATISEKSCVSISQLMTFKEKRSYLEAHCHNL